MAYHVEVIPAGAIISIITVAVILSKKYRISGTTLLFLFALALCLFASVAGLYPLGGIKQSLILGPIILISFAHAVCAASEVILSKISKGRLSSAISYRALSIVVSLLICAIGFSDVAKYRNVYTDPVEIFPVLQLVEKQREDGDIVVWRTSAAEVLRYYEDSIPSWSRFCFGLEECMDILRELPDGVTRIWLAPHYETGMYGYDILAHVFGLNLVEMKIRNGFSFRLVRNARMAAQYLDDIDGNNDIIEDDNNLAYQNVDLRIYMKNSSLLYVQTGNCQEMTPFILHIYPLDQNDLPVTAQKYGFENRDFDFIRYANYFAGRCIAVRFLPDYPIRRIRVGQYGEWSRLIDPNFSLGPADITRDFLERLDAPILEHDQMSVYRADGNLIYVTNCNADMNVPIFFFHIYPVSVSDLPVEAQEYGFENRDFRFQDYASAVGETCVVARPLPGYPIASIHTGQYDETGKIWAADLAWEPEPPLAE